MLYSRESLSSILRHATAYLLIMTLSCIALMFASSSAIADAPAIGIQQYAIAPGKLRIALDLLALQSNVQIVYSPELVEGKTNRETSGLYKPVEVLRRLLIGTGLTWKAVNDFTFVLLKTSPSDIDSVKNVTKNAGNVVRSLEAVNVSGSLINNAQIQTATPTYTITSESINARGFTSLAEVLQNSVLAVGSVEGPQLAYAFTQAAQAVSLYGLGPEFTLILIDGKPIVGFGQLYSGSNNFNNLSNIPLSMIDHIDVMPGGASSIYGSAAVAGVINIVTRQYMDGGNVSVRTGNFSDGGGANQHLTFSFGHDFGKLDMLAALEFDNVSPIWGYQRALTAGSSANPNGLATPIEQSAIADFGTVNSFTDKVKGYLSPPGGCDSSLFGNSTFLATDNNVPNLYGQYCGSRYVNGYSTFSNQNRSYNGMLKLKYDVTDNVRLYSDVMLNWQQQKWFPGPVEWSPIDLPEGAIEDASTGHILYPERIFAPEEMPGGAAGQMYRQQDLLYQSDVGANGQFGESNWNWDAYYLRSADRTDVVEPLPLAAGIDSFFEHILGPVVGVDPSTGLNMYHPDYAAFFQPVTPAQYASFTQDIDEFSNTWINDTRASISNTHLFNLSGGYASVATLIEGGNEAWHEPVNTLFTDGAIYEHTASGGGGQRSHAASAFELNLPAFNSLTFDLSGRYDHYSLDEGSSNHKFTYKVGIEYRPFDVLLLRGNYATVFRAPDLSNLFLSPTSGYADATDYYQCALSHSANCSPYVVNVMSLANPRLQPTVAQSWTVGTVWSPADNLSLSVDYLRIAIQNEIVQQSLDLLLREDAQCLLGQLDSASSACQAITNPVNGQVQRAGSGGLANGLGSVSGITTYYVNAASEMTESIAATGKYQFSLARFGKVGVELDYNDMLRHDYPLSPGQLTPNSIGFKSIFSGALSWSSSNARWSSTLYGHRYGSSPNNIAILNGLAYPGAGRVPPWITFNWSLTYTPVSNFSLSALINNIANKMPPSDPTDTVYPYFNVDDYNIYGREIMLQLNFKLGGGIN